MHKRVLRLEVCFVRRRRIPQRSGVLVVVNPAPSSALSGEGELKRGEMRSHYSHSLFPPLLFSPRIHSLPKLGQKLLFLSGQVKAPLLPFFPPKKEGEDQNIVLCPERIFFGSSPPHWSMSTAAAFPPWSHTPFKLDSGRGRAFSGEE